MAHLTFYPMQTYSDSITSFFAYDPYIEKFWLRLLGPTATLLLNDLSLKALLNDEPFYEDVSALSLRLGTGSRDGSSSPVKKQLNRLVKMGVFTLFNENEFLIPRIIEPLFNNFLYKLSSSELKEHDMWIDRLHQSPLETQRKRAQQLILHLKATGTNYEKVYKAITTSGLHPSIIGEALLNSGYQHSAA